MDKKVCVVTVAYNSPDLLNVLLDSLIQQTYKIYKVIIVDNSEEKFRDLNKKIISRYNLDIIYINCNKNLGSAAGFSIGMKRAHNEKADFVWLIDDDGMPENECLEVLIKNKDKGGILCPKVIDEKDNTKTLTIFRLKEGLLGKLLPCESNSKYYYIDCFGTNGVLISKNVLENIGYYDYNNFFVGGEDLEYSFRAKNKGYKIVLINDAIISHPNLMKKHNNKESYVGKLAKIFKINILLPRFLSYVSKKNNLSENRVKGYAYILGRYGKIGGIFFSILYSVIKVLLIKFKSFNEVSIIDTYKIYYRGLIDGLSKR